MVSAGREEVPGRERYDGYLQLENGVGMLRLLFNEFEEALREAGREMTRRKNFLLQRQSWHIRILDVWQGGCREISRVEVHTYCIRNDFFGERITVSGLITGQDLMAS